MFDQSHPVLFVDDDPALRAANAQSLELAGIDAITLPNAAKALERIDAQLTGAIVSDIRMPGMDGLQLLARVQAIDAELPVILITGHADVPTAVSALRDGAFDFLTKPFAADHLVASVRRALESRRLVLENRSLRAAIANAEETEPLIGDSPAIVTLRDSITQIAQAGIDVLVEGETGSGKELVARLLHLWGPRRGRPFVAINCAALPADLAEDELFGRGGSPGRAERPGRIESSNHGTLFLDEIDSMELNVQAKLLRVLEEREVPVAGDHPRQLNLRVVAASKRDLVEAAAQGRFREDLLYRINVIRLRVPPLRERRADVPVLFVHFLETAERQLGRKAPPLTASIRAQLVDYDWPGNVRELRNFAYRVVLDLPEPASAGATDCRTLPERMEAIEGSLIRNALTACGGDIRRTLDALGIPRKTLYDKLSRHGLQPREFRPRP